MMDALLQPDRFVAVAIYAIAIAALIGRPTATGESAHDRPPWWRRVEVWAAVVLIAQGLMYAVWG